MATTNPQLERAKQGDPEAIAALMRRSLEPKGINVQAESGGDVLRVVLEGSQPVNREALLAFIRKGMLQLGVKGLRSIAVEWRQPGSLLTDWTDSISLDDDEPYGLDALSMSQIEAPNTPPVDMDALSDDDSYGGGYGAQYGMEDDSLPMDDDESLESEDSSEPTKPAKKGGGGGLIGLLLGLIAIGGGLYYLYTKGHLNEVVASLPPEVQVYLPPVTPESAEPAITADGTEAPATSPAPAAESPAASPAPAEAPAASPAPASPAPAAESPAAEAPAAVPASPAPASPAPAASPAANQPNPDFAEAVRKATSAAKLAQTAKTKAEWTTVAAEWQAASALMQKVPADSPNASIAQNRAPQYAQNAAIARANAQAAPQ